MGLVRVPLVSPVGLLTLVASDVGLRAVLWPRHDGGVPASVAGARLDHGNPVLAGAADQLRAWFDGSRRRFRLPLDPVGTDFQLAVWHRIAQVPFGATTTYGRIARDLGRDPAAASQAVGAATGANPLSIVVPCHRVMGADGSLTGFAGGLATKRWLLDHESPQAALF